jgi:hypothetical protein
MKINFKQYFKQIDFYIVNDIAEKVAEYFNEEGFNTGQDIEGKNYLTKKVKQKPDFSKEEIEKLMVPIIHLIAMNHFYEYAESLQAAVNTKFNVSLDCEFPTFDGDDYLNYQGNIAEALIEHFS